MGLFDRLNNRRINLADGAELKPTQEATTSEIGVAGDSLVGGYGADEQRSDKLTIQDYVRMRQTDGTVASLYNILTLPILSTPYSIEADEDDASEEQAELVRKNLLAPPHRGGMEIPLSLVLADMLRAVLEGFRAFEKVYMLQDGKVVYKKLASRDATTVTLRRGDDGGYDGLHQQTSFKGRYVDVVIPAWKTLLFTYAKDRDYLYGESAFKAAHYHYDLKHKFYYLSQIQAQARAVAPGVVQPGEGADTGDKQKNALLGAVDALGRIRSTLYLPKGYTLTPYDVGKGVMDYMPYIDHHDTQMARSILAQFLMLGTTSESKGGSYALSDNHSDIFLLALKGAMQNIADHINYFVIPDLIDLNFAAPAYPEFRFEDMTSDAKEIIKGAFDTLLSSGKIDEALVRGIEDRMAESLEIDREAIQKELDKEKQQRIAEAKAAGIEVDQDGNPLPVVAPQPQPGKQPGVINQSDKVAGVVPKGPSPSGASPRPLRGGSSLDRYRSALLH